MANVFVIIILTVYRGTGLHLPNSLLKKLVVYQVGRLLFYLQFVVTCECPAFPVVLKDQMNILWDNELNVDVPNLTCLSVMTLHCCLHLWDHTKRQV